MIKTIQNQNKDYEEQLNNFELMKNAIAEVKQDQDIPKAQ